MTLLGSARSDNLAKRDKVPVSLAKLLKEWRGGNAGTPLTT